MKHILAATDLSPRADRAVERAFHLAKAHGAALTVLTVTDEAMPDRLAAVMTPETEAHLKSFCDGLSQGGSIPFTTRVEQGDPSHTIPDVAQDVGSDLVVLGLHRRRAFLDTFRETTLERVVRLCSEPVLLIRNHSEGAFSNVLAAADFSPASTAAIRAAHTLAPDAGIHGFHAVHVPVSSHDPSDPRAAVAVGFVRDAEDARDRWMDRSPVPPALAEVRIVKGGLSQVFQEEFARLRPDLIALGAHARFGLTHRVLGSFALELVRDPPTDLLIAKPDGD